MRHKLAGLFSNGIRSWTFLIIFVSWTALWWGGLGDKFGDPSPYLQWSLYTTFLTELDLIVYGIFQRAQSSDDTQMQKNQLDTMKLLLALAERMEKDIDELVEDLVADDASPITSEVLSE